MIEDDRKKDFTEQAWKVLRMCQIRDAKELGLNMDAAKDNIINDLSFGRWALSIPVQHYEILTMIMPDIQSSEPELKSAAYKKFMLMDESLPYKVNTKQRSI